jgi:hypothetical protein
MIFLFAILTIAFAMALLSVVLAWRDARGRAAEIRDRELASRLAAASRTREVTSAPEPGLDPEDEPFDAQQEIAAVNRRIERLEHMLRKTQRRLESMNRPAQDAGDAEEPVATVVFPYRQRSS